MEQWIKDGRHMLFERWQQMGGVVGGKSQPTSVRDVDDAVLQKVLAVFAANKHHACVSSRLLHKDMCRVLTTAEEEEEEAAAATTAAAPQEKPLLAFRFSDGQFAPGIDRSGYFGLVQRIVPSGSSAATITTGGEAPQPHARVLLDYCWVFRGRIYDYTQGFSFIAGAGVVPQALEEAVLYCKSTGAQSVEHLYEVASEFQIKVDSTNRNSNEKLNEGDDLDGFEEFLCDGDFAFRDEGTRLEATEFAVGFCNDNNGAADNGNGDEPTGHRRRRIAVKAEVPAMLIPPDSTVSLLVRVRKFCNAVSMSKHILLAESLKNKGNEVLTSKEEEEEEPEEQQQGEAEQEQQEQEKPQQQQQQQQEKHVDCCDNNDSSNADDAEKQGLAKAAAAIQEIIGGDADSNTKKKPSKFERARGWYERAMLELSPEALRTGEKSTAGHRDEDKTTPAATEEQFRKLLAALTHNIALCYFEEAGLVMNANNNLNKNSSSSSSYDNAAHHHEKKQQQQRDLLKKSINFASEAVKVSLGKHTKSLFRRAAANALLGNFGEAEADLKNMENVAPGSTQDSAVVALRERIRDEYKRADATIRGAMAKGLFA